MEQTETLQLSIGEDISRRRLGGNAWSGTVSLYDKPVHFEISEYAIMALAERDAILLVDLELYFSCLVRKQVRFNEMRSNTPDSDRYTQVVPGLYTCFCAVTTKECRRSEVDGKPPVAAMPVKNPGHFVPDRVRIDFRAGKWRGEYGIGRTI